MNGSVSRGRLVLVAMCFTVLVVAGVAYSEAVDDSLCLEAEALHFKVSIWMATCPNPQKCSDGQDILDSLDCIISDCWDLVDGVCSAAAA